MIGTLYITPYQNRVTYLAAIRNYAVRLQSFRNILIKDNKCEESTVTPI